MTYRGFKRPEFFDGEHTTDDWIAWLGEQGDVLLPVAPRHKGSCACCYGASGYIDGGPETWNQCVNCYGYNGAVDRFIPITYSIDMGLESMLHRFKDFKGYDWLRYPLASLLHEFIDAHGDCIDAQAPRRQIDVATLVPPNDPRSFNHLDYLLQGVVDGDPLMNRWDWDLGFLTRDTSTSRPKRGELRPSAYKVAPLVVEGSSVLLLDDTWTSGASAASSAAALKDAGARHVTVLTLGRQLNLSTDYGSTAVLYDDRRGEGWDLGECVICA